MKDITESTKTTAKRIICINFVDELIIERLKNGEAIYPSKPMRDQTKGAITLKARFLPKIIVGMLIRQITNTKRGT